MTSGRTEQTKYQLRELPHQDYHRQLQGLPISRRALLTTTIEEATHESVAVKFEEREATQEETNMTTGLDQLAARMAQIVQRQEERQQREKDYHREQEEERQQRDEKYHRQQDAKHREQLRAMQEQLQALRERRSTTNSHLKMTSFQESEDIQDFL